MQSTVFFRIAIHAYEIYKGRLATLAQFCASGTVCHVPFLRGPGPFLIESVSSHYKIPSTTKSQLSRLVVPVIV